MNVLILPQNIASMASVTVEALNKIPGVSAKYVVQHIHKYQKRDQNEIYIPKTCSKRNPIKWILHRINEKRVYRKLIKEADVLHYLWGPAFESGIDLGIAHKYNKKIFVEWLGSDIRNPNILKLINQYYKESLSNGYEYLDLETHGRGYNLQKLFKEHGAIPLACPEMSLFIDTTLFNDVISIFQRINCNDIVPIYPEINQTHRPVIVHSPTAKIAKGTNYLLPIIEDLKKDFDFDFELVHNLPKSEAFEMIKKADIFVDQLIGGGYGVATLEAMSLGKPVICYIMKEVYDAGLPKTCPIVNANPDTVKEKLILLLSNPKLRNKIGIQSRKFVEEYHNADLLAKDLVSIYSGKKTK